MVFRRPKGDAIKKTDALFELSRKKKGFWKTSSSSVINTGIGSRNYYMLYPLFMSTGPYSPFSKTLALTSEHLKIPRANGLAG